MTFDLQTSVGSCSVGFLESEEMCFRITSVELIRKGTLYSSLPEAIEKIK